MTTTVIPDQLSILLRTDLPGQQDVVFKPTMLIPTLSPDDNVVCFNPLIELDKDKVAQIPEGVRIKQFFNRPLFDSMLNYMRGANRAVTLDEATKRGFVDNNIRVTLFFLFAPGTVLYLSSNQPHVVVDSVWSDGDWKIDLTVKLKEVSASKLSPIQQHYDQQKNVEIGKQQLANLPEDLAYGAGFRGERKHRPKPATSTGPPVPPPPPGPTPASITAAVTMVPPPNTLTGGTGPTGANNVVPSPLPPNTLTGGTGSGNMPGGGHGGALNQLNLSGSLYKDPYASKLAYVVPIFMQLYPGTDLTPEQWKEATCSHNFNMMSKSFADLVNQPYCIVPVYDRKATTAAKPNTRGGKGTHSSRKNKTKSNNKRTTKKKRDPSRAQ